MTYEELITTYPRLNKCGWCGASGEQSCTVKVPNFDMSKGRLVKRGYKTIPGPDHLHRYAIPDSEWDD